MRSDFTAKLHVVTEVVEPVPWLLKTRRLPTVTELPGRFAATYLDSTNRPIETMWDEIRVINVQNGRAVSRSLQRCIAHGMIAANHDLLGEDQRLSAFGALSERIEAALAKAIVGIGEPNPIRSSFTGGQISPYRPAKKASPLQGPPIPRDVGRS